MGKHVVGIGKPSLTLKLDQLAREGKQVIITNISRIDLMNKCYQRYYWEYAHGKIGVVRRDAQPKAALEIGTAIHEGARILLDQHKCGAELNAKGAATHALEVASVGLHHRGGYSPDNLMELESFERYAFPLFKAAAKQLRPIDRVLYTETLVWYVASYGEVNVCLVGRVDAIIQEAGKLWHLQHKSRSRETGYDTYITKLGFGGHETGYGFILNALTNTDELPSLPYGGSKVLMWLKQEPPSNEEVPMPKGLTAAMEKGQILLHGTHTIERCTCTERQWEKAVSMHENWGTREDKRREALRSYDDRIAQMLDVDIDEGKMNTGVKRLLMSAITQHQLNNQTTIPKLSPLNTSACDQYGVCPFLESVSCGGWDDCNLDDPDGVWVRRSPDYVDNLRAYFKEEREYHVNPQIELFKGDANAAPE